MKKTKSSLCLILIYTILMNLFAPLANAQTVGLKFELREGVTNSLVKREISLNTATDLSKADTNAILRRLPPMTSDENNWGTNFALRSKTNLPPRTGSVIPIKFPADEDSNKPDVNAKTNAALEVVRFAPDGKMPLVADLSITFSQPMIAVTSQTEASENVPVILSPNVNGKWRWLGTTTLIFDADSRFPMATKFTATIPAGTKSAIGGTLAKEFSWKFKTPPPAVEVFAPNSKNQQVFEREQIMSAKFNQEIDETAVLPKINVTANGKQIPIHLVTQELDESFVAVQALGKAKPKHWIAFRAVEQLPLDSEIKVTFEKGVPSVEGSLTSDTAQEFAFKTYGAFKFINSHCGNYYNDEKNEQCQPSENFWFKFNNQLYPAPIDASQVKIEPALEDAKINMSGNNLIISGKKLARTIYKVTVSPTLKDWYQQTLGSEITATFKVGAERPRFFAPGGNFVTLDPQAIPKFSLYSRNQPNFQSKFTQ